MFKALSLALVLGATGTTTVALAGQQVAGAQSAVAVSFQASETHDYTASERALISDILNQAYQTTKADFPQLADAISVELHPINRPGVDALGTDVAVTVQTKSPLSMSLPMTVPLGKYG